HQNGSPPLTTTAQPTASWVTREHSGVKFHASPDKNGTRSSSAADPQRSDQSAFTDPCWQGGNGGLWPLNGHNPPLAGHQPRIPGHIHGRTSVHRSWMSQNPHSSRAVATRSHSPTRAGELAYVDGRHTYPG